MDIDVALTMGRMAAVILEAPPLGEGGYSDDEVAAQYAATDRLLAAFAQLDTALKDK